MTQNHVPRLRDVWEHWSYSKLKTLFNCPLQFWFEYVLHQKAPKPPILAVGAALHYVAARFFRLHYQSKETFCGSWKYVWVGVVKKQFGTEGPRSQPINIAWKSDKEPWYWLEHGREIAEKFFDRYADQREPTPGGPALGALVERRFRSDWRGFALAGIMDRVDEFPDYVEITDYKMASDPAPLVESSFQHVFYQLGYEDRLRYQKFGGKPLRAVNFENLFSGASQNVLPHGVDDLTSFYRYLTEAANFVRAVLQHRTLFGQTDLQYLHPISVSEQLFHPRLPRGLHCKYCLYMDDCVAWEKSQKQPAREIWIERWCEARRLALPEQLELCFG